MNLYCAHGKPIVLEVERGITTYIHAGEVGEESICTVSNSFTLTIDQILSYKTSKFVLSPEFRAAFLVSSLARRKVYELIVKINNEKLKKGLLAIDEIVSGTPHESFIIGEMVGVFGNIVVSNLNSLTQKDYPFDRVVYTAFNKQLTMRPIDGMTFDEVSAELEADRKQKRSKFARK